MFVAFSSQFRDPHESYLREHSEDHDTNGPFGLEYTFTLRETELNKNAVDDVPEWMLPLDALKVRGYRKYMEKYSCCTRIYSFPLVQQLPNRNSYAMGRYRVAVSHAESAFISSHEYSFLCEFEPFMHHP